MFDNKIIPLDSFESQGKVEKLENEEMNSDDNVKSTKNST